MRRLLVKLVALETAVLGWLSYWLFLVYANNPSVSQGLASELSRFPQVSYTTIDISIIVIIGVFSIVMAVRFDRSLRPGMKLERALQMLESLMKRNLFLEAQLAETRVDKSIPSFSSPATQTSLNPTVNYPPSSNAGGTSFSSGLSSPGAKAAAESSSSSWENAFRIPIEAGPPAGKLSVPSRPTPVQSLGQSPISNSQPVSKPVIESQRQAIEVSKNTSQSSERKEDHQPAHLPLNSKGWEDSPRRTMETRGIITPSQQPPHKPLSQVLQSSSGRLPYIPMPPPKAAAPSLVASMTPPSASPPPSPAPQTPTPSQSPQQTSTLKTGVPAQARPTSKTTQIQASASSSTVSRSQSLPPSSPSPILYPLFQAVKSQSNPQQTSPQKPPPQEKPEQKDLRTIGPRTEKESGRDAEDDDDDERAQLNWNKGDDDEEDVETAHDGKDDDDGDDNASSLEDDSE